MLREVKTMREFLFIMKLSSKKAFDLTIALVLRFKLLSSLFSCDIVLIKRPCRGIFHSLGKSEDFLSLRKCLG